MFGALQGNAKVIVLTEGVSGIFLQWFNTYLPLYMLALGVSKVQVGFLASALIAMRTLSTLLGAYAADRLGRKRTLVLFDILCWGIPLFLFTIAQNPWYFLVGQLLNGLVYVVLPSFECLFVEDVPRARRTAVFGSLSFLFAAASLLTPVAGWLVAVLGMETGGRVIMAGSLIAILAAAAVRQFTLRETTMGVLRMDATANLGIGALFQEYRATLAQMVGNKRVRSFLGVRMLVAFSLTIWTTYAAIYLTDSAGLGLAEATISLLPMVTALVTMALILLAARRMRAAWTFSNLSWGLIGWLLAGFCFVVAPSQALLLAVLWAALSAASKALFQPASQSYWANIVGDHERAQVFAVSAALLALATVPAGPLAGLLYTLSPRSPFVLAMALQAAALVWIRRLGLGRPVWCGNSIPDTLLSRNTRL